MITIFLIWLIAVLASHERINEYPDRVGDTALSG